MEKHNLKSKYQIEIRQIDRLLTVEEVSPILQIPASSIYKILSGERSFPLPLAIRLGRFWRFKESAVERFIAELGVTQEEVVAEVAEVAPSNSAHQEKRKRGRPPLQPRELAGVAA